MYQLTFQESLKNMNLNAFLYFIKVFFDFKTCGFKIISTFVAG